MTYLELFNTLKQINKNYYLDEIIYEFIYDDKVNDKLSFIENRNKEVLNYENKIKQFKKCILENIPWERILKYTYFYNLKLKLYDNVFSPRKDTELLVHFFLKDNYNISNQRIVDLGTGSGAILLAIANNINPSNHFIGYENNVNAINNTIKNFDLYNKNIQLIYKDYLEQIKTNSLIECDYIVCNPPYINPKFKLENNVINYDPYSALFSDDEIYYYKEIIKYFNKNKKIKAIYFEIGFNQKEILTDYLNQLKIENYRFEKDLNNNDRILIIYNKK